jgi:hypothetical protein
MKKLLLPLLLFFSIAVQAQTTYLSDFYLEDGSVIYKKVFETKADKDTFLKQLLTTTGIGGVEEKGDMLIGELKNMKSDYKKHGGSWGSSALVLNHDIFGNFIIEFKDDRYRLIISNMYFVDNYSVLAASQTNPENNKMTLEDFFVKNKKAEFRSGKVRMEALHYIDKQFTEVFTAKESSAASEDW